MAYPDLISYSINTELTGQLNTAYVVRMALEFGGTSTDPGYGTIFRNPENSNNMATSLNLTPYFSFPHDDLFGEDWQDYVIDFGHGTLYDAALSVPDGFFNVIYIGDNIALRVGLENRGTENEYLYIDILQQDYTEIGFLKVWGEGSTYKHNYVVWKRLNYYLPQVYPDEGYINLYSEADANYNNNNLGDLGNVRYMAIAGIYQLNGDEKRYNVYSLPTILMSFYREQAPIYVGYGLVLQELGENVVSYNAPTEESSRWYYKGIFNRNVNDPPPSEGGNGGNGNYDDSTDPIPLPEPPNITPIGTKFLSMYVIDKTNIDVLGGYMWSKNFFDNFSKIFQNPIDAIVSLQLVRYRDLSAQGAQTDVYVGALNTGATGVKLTEGTYTLDCGTLEVGKYYDTFLDYNPYTTYKLYLPYIGFVNLDANMVTNSNLTVKYYIDLLTGLGVCFVYIKSEKFSGVLYNFNCQCSVSVPFTGANYTSYYTAMLNLATGLNSVNKGIEAANNANKGGAEQDGTTDYVLSTLSAGFSAKTEIQQSGGGGGSVAGYLGLQKPFLVIERPNNVFPRGYKKYFGYPTFITTKLSKLKGFVKVAEIHLENIPNITSTELEELNSLLKEGVYL